MQNSIVEGISLYDIMFWFYIYSFIGWVFESTYVSIKHKKFVNRGFISGPLCTVYGCGSVFVILMLWNYKDNLVWLFLGGMIVTTMIEFFTSILMELFFKTKWWDYSDKKFNLQGRICLESSIAWGAFSVILLKVLHPLATGIVAQIPIKKGITILTVITILFVTDFIIAVFVALQLKNRLLKLDDIITEITRYISAGKLYESKEEWKERMEVLRASFDDLWEERKQIIIDSLERKGLWELKKEISEKLEGFTKKYNAIKNKTNFLQERYLRAYPQIKIVTESLQEKFHKSIHKKKVCLSDTDVNVDADIRIDTDTRMDEDIKIDTDTRINVDKAIDTDTNTDIDTGNAD